MKATDDEVHRRDVLRIGGLAAVGMAALSQPALAAHLGEIARALTPYNLSEPSTDTQAPQLAALARAVASAKRNYQACRYAAVLGELPALLDDANLACSVMSGDDLRQAHHLAADAYQVVGSVMLKLGDSALAALAADRSMVAAIRNEDPAVIGASARIITHSLMSGGYARRAVEIATRAAERMDHEVTTPSPDTISVYGALILRGAIAAAKVGNRAGTASLLDEAEDAARRLGRDDNAHWTSFGPTNVLLHRVNVALELGDAGTALDLANRVDLTKLALPERKATLHLDMAAAYAQWGRFEPAYESLRLAAQIAPEEIRSRKGVHVLVADLAQRSPRSVRTRVLELADEIGVEV
jgi:tetratricopeptide (TPR) repeat protein